VHVNEYMDIFCPQYDADAPESEVLTFVIYNVSQESFEGCTRPQGEAAFVVVASPLPTFARISRLF